MDNNGSNEFTCDLLSSSTSFPHFWEHTVGSCHATMALRADWQQQLKRCSKELGFKHVRFHGLLCDDMGTLMCEMEKYVYSFFNADQVWDFLLSIGMRPFVELSFMPSTLASGGDIVFHYKANVTPPRDYNAWSTLISKLVTHWKERYGADEVREWFFEVWNEPNLDAFWKGTQQDYFKLYEYTARAIKQVDNTFKVGGPATANNEWIPEFTGFCVKNNVPFDFISTHHYPTDSFGQPGDDTITQLSKSRRSVLREEAQAVKQKAGDKPVYYTEWSSSSNPFDDLHDEPYAAAFITKTVMEMTGIVDGYSYWTFSDVFEENYFSSVPFHGGFGLMNIYGIPKPSYRAFELLHNLGDELIPVGGRHETVDIWVVRKEDVIQVLITNWALPRHPIKEEQLTIKITNIPRVDNVFVQRIDKEHANARKRWEDAGRPGSLGKIQVAELEKASALVKEPLAAQHNGQTLCIEIKMGIQAIACITIET